jgi:hypothetical protein
MTELHKEGNRVNKTLSTIALSFLGIAALIALSLIVVGIVDANGGALITGTCIAVIAVGSSVIIRVAGRSTRKSG